MTATTQPIPLMPSLQVAVDRFLARSRFAARTRDSYTQDLASLLAYAGNQPVSALTHGVASTYLAAHEHLAASTFHRRYAALRRFAHWCKGQGWLHDDPLIGLERRPQPRREPRALDPTQVEARLRTIHVARDRALFWLIYEGALRCREALAIDVDDIDWMERCIRIHGKGDRPRETFFSRRVSGYLDAYLKERGALAHGPLFVTVRRARNPRHADLTAEGYARLSYRQADTLWKRPSVTERDTGGKVATFGARVKGRFPCGKRYFGLFCSPQVPRRGSFAGVDGTKGAPPVELATFHLLLSLARSYVGSK